MDDGEGFCGGKKEDVTLPKATLTKIMKEMLPKDVRIGKNTQDLLGDCCYEFIALLSSEANEVCSKEDKKTISPEHVLEALKSLGFSGYVPEVQEAYDQFKLDSMESPRPGGKSSAKDAKTGGMTDEEAIAEQQKMFAAARAAMNMGTPAGLLSPPSASSSEHNKE